MPVLHRLRESILAREERAGCARILTFREPELRLGKESCRCTQSAGSGEGEVRHPREVSSEHAAQTACTEEPESERHAEQHHQPDVDREAEAEAEAPVRRL